MEADTTTGTVRRSDVPGATVDAVWRRFHAALEPLRPRLGTVLLQFPPWLAHGEAAIRRIEDTIARRRGPARRGAPGRAGGRADGRLSRFRAATAAR
ncbi:DUF72 domain-containing protein [Dactylosporangium sp. NPDC049140]|uniref:DUF72 domain-containing protein n=1 Tax=Dactylosporangium sp. NPDC049140 TaxID=3155647 RepID=UPI0033EB7B3C